METKRDQVIAAVRDRLHRFDWFKGVCRDQIPSEDEITEANFAEVVDQVALDTESWDNPNFGRS
jgi:hypothetical protein